MKKKETKKADLFFCEGTSDKEYHLEILPEGEGFVVNFAYGRRGSNLKTGTKTPEPVDEETATEIFEKFLNEKLAKGYE